MNGDPDLPLRRMLAVLGAAMVASGQPIDDVEDELAEVAARFGATDAQIGAGPTSVTIALAGGAPATFEAVHAGLALDQAAQVRAIRYDLATGELDIDTATDRLLALRDTPPRYPRWLTDLGYVGISLGICLIMQPGPANLLAAALAGFVVVTLTHVVTRYPALDALLPTAAGFAAALIVLGAAEAGLLEGPLRTVLPPLAVLLPGALIVTGISELAAGAMVAGTARLVYGTVQLLLFTVGIAAAAAALRVPAHVLANVRVDAPGWWTAPLGLAGIAVGLALMTSPPARTLPWVFAILAATFTVQFVGQWAGHPVLGTFLAAVTASLGASVAELIDRTLPRLVVFLPSFWLLVPGSLGLLGVSQIAVAADGGVPTLGQVPTQVLAISVGLLVGSVAAHPLRVLRRRVRQRWGMVRRAPAAGG